MNRGVAKVVILLPQQGKGGWKNHTYLDIKMSFFGKRTLQGNEGTSERRSEGTAKRVNNTNSALFKKKLVNGKGRVQACLLKGWKKLP